jgi:hypothetical protein
MLDVIYTLMLEETKEEREARKRLDAELSALTQRTVTGKPDRATWGRLPHQQAAMKAAQTAAG